MTEKNEAAERLRERFAMRQEGDRDTLTRLLGQAMQAERRATVERIREEVRRKVGTGAVGERVNWAYATTLAILDEEAAR